MRVVLEGEGGIGVLEAGFEVIECVGREGSLEYCASLVCDARDASPHPPGIIGPEVSWILWVYARLALFAPVFCSRHAILSASLVSDGNAASWLSAETAA